MGGNQREHKPANRKPKQGRGGASCWAAGARRAAGGRGARGAGRGARGVLMRATGRGGVRCGGAGGGRPAALACQIGAGQTVQGKRCRANVRAKTYALQGTRRGTRRARAGEPRVDALRSPYGPEKRPMALKTVTHPTTPMRTQVEYAVVISSHAIAYVKPDAGKVGSMRGAQFGCPPRRGSMAAHRSCNLHATA